MWTSTLQPKHLHLFLQSFRSCHILQSNKPPTSDELSKKKCTIGTPSKDRNKFILPISLGPCLKYYSVIRHETALRKFLIRIICDYVDDFNNSKVCELCQCWSLKLTAHHLVPRCIHPFAIRVGWDPNEERGGLNSIAWLCQGCHRFVHRILDPRALAAHYWTVQLLLSRTEIWQYTDTIRKLVQKVD